MGLKKIENPNIISLDHKIQQQIDLLKYSLESGIHLSKLLAKDKLNYDNLSYLNNISLNYTKSICRTLEDFAEVNNNIPVVSFFSGAGGLDIGFEVAGFDHKILFEKNELFCKTILHNRPNWSVLSADISNYELMHEEISKYIGPSNKFDGVFIGGPPCQPFSIASNQRFSKDGENFKRTGFNHKTNGNLLFDYIKLIVSFKPKSFLIENVPGLLDVDNGEQLAKAYKILEDVGYIVQQPMVLRADAYYVPQQRVRLFIVGSRTAKDYIPPKQSNFTTNVGGIFDIDILNVKNHITREHNAESILRYMYLDYGQRDKLGRVDRLDPSLPSKTVIAGGTSGGGRSHLHPYFPRTLSVRESARIQTFPDSYEFIGPVARQFTQVGNAVPPILGAQIAHSIYKSFYQ